MAKKETVQKEIDRDVVAPIDAPAVQAVVDESPKQKLKQKIDDALNGKTIIDNHDLREVLQYL